MHHFVTDFDRRKRPKVGEFWSEFGNEPTRPIGDPILVVRGWRNESLPFRDESLLESIGLDLKSLDDVESWRHDDESSWTLD